MVFSDAIEVAIGLTFMFLLMSLALTGTAEFIESLRKRRGVGLHASIIELLGEPNNSSQAASGNDAARAVYSHPLVQGLYIGSYDTALQQRKLPSYLPANIFAAALIDQVLAAKVNSAQTNASVPARSPIGDRLQLAAERIQNDHLRCAILTAVQAGQNDREKISRSLEDWFNSAMERQSGRYRRNSQHMLLILGLICAVALNVNTWSVANSLLTDSNLRHSIAAEASAHATRGEPAASAAFERMEGLGLPVGWSDNSTRRLDKFVSHDNAWAKAGGWIQLIIGYVLTAVAASLGAPFWFDFLNRLVSIRSTTKPRESTEPAISPTSPGSSVASISPATSTEASRNPTDAEHIDHDVYAVLPDYSDKCFEEWE